MKILFITPPFHAGVVEVAGRWVPLNFVYLAGAARAAGHEPVIYDAMTKFAGYEQIEEAIRREAPDIVATSAITCTSLDAIKVVELAKKVGAGIVTLIGGVHASFMYEEMLGLTEAIDYIVVGEGERTLPELLDVLGDGGGVTGVKGVAYKESGKVVFTGQRPLIEDLDALPSAWDLLDWSDYKYFVLPGSRLGAISTSRGCEKDCTFCSQRLFWQKKWRARSARDVVREVRELSTVHGVDVILLTDDYPSPDRERWEKFLDLMIEEDLPVQFLMETRAEDIVRDADILWKYKKAGIIHIYVGTEATDQASLDLIKKDITVEQSRQALDLLREAGIITETSFILGFPGDTFQSIARTLELAKEYNPDFAHFLAIAPWPYSDIYPDMEPHIEVFDYTKYNLIDPVVKPIAMTLKDIDRAIVECYRDFYMSKFTETLDSGDRFKKDYLIRAMKLMMSDSFIKEKIGMVHGDMPEEIKRIIDSTIV